MYGVGIIGTGRHGVRYVQHILHDVDGLTLQAISRRSEVGRQQAADWGVQWYPQWQELIADSRVQCIISVVPPHLNLDIARECANARKPLLVEKPLAGDGVTAQAIVNLMEDATCPLTVGQTLRYNPVIEGLRRELGSQGQLYSFTANQRLEPVKRSWHDEQQIAGAGVVIHTAVHVFDALYHITGLRGKRLIALGRKHHTEALEDLVTIMVEMENDVIGTIDVSKVCSGRSGRYEFVCQSGQLYGEQVHGMTERIDREGHHRLQTYGPKSTIIPLLQDWRAFIRGAGENPVSGAEGLYAVRACDACIESARSGQWVTI